MIKLKNLLNEVIYSNIATVYHRTRVEDIANKIYDTGFTPGGGDAYGRGFYSTYELESQEGLKMQHYGNVVLKCAVNLSDFFFFDWSEFIKTPLFKYKLVKSTEETFIQDQIQYYKINLDSKYDARSVNYTSQIASFIHDESDLDKKVAGIVFTGRTDGKVLVCYDVKRIQPLAYKKDGEDWVKGELTKDFIKKSSVSAINANMSKYSLFGYGSLVDNRDGTFDINGNLWLSKIKKLLPGIRNVYGVVYASNRGLTTLENFPTGTVRDTLEISMNKLTSLEHSPKKVSSLSCTDNLLTNLKYCPEIFRSLDCSDNRITSLEGCPPNLDTLICSYNQLTTLDGAGFVGIVECEDNQLTSLGSTGTFIKVKCANNQLTSLDFPSIQSTEYLYCHGNKISSLKGCPDSLIELDCSHNQLTNLAYCPKNLRSLYCSYNNLTSLKGCPEHLTGDLYCQGNNLQTLEGFPKSIQGGFKHSSKFTEEEIRAVCKIGGYVEFSRR
jgi:hypothetical protein